MSTPTTATFKRAGTIFFFLSGILLSASCGGVVGESGHHHSASHAGVIKALPMADVKETALAGGNAEQQALAKRVAAAFDGWNAIKAVRFVEPPAEYGAPVGSTWLDIEVQAPERASAAKAVWQALLLVGALRNLSAQSGLPPVQGKKVTIFYPDGSHEDGGESSLGPPAPISDPPISKADALSQINEGATRARASVEATNVSHPLGEAFAITAVTQDPGAFVRERNARIGQIIGKLGPEQAPANVDGVYLEVLDERGKLVTATGYSRLLHEGVGWTDPALSARDSSFTPTK